MLTSSDILAVCSGERLSGDMALMPLLATLPVAAVLFFALGLSCAVYKQHAPGGLEELPGPKGDHHF